MKNRFSVFLALTILYALLIFILSSSSSLGDPRTILGFFHFENLRSLLKPIENSDLRVLLYPLYIFSEYPDKVGHVVLYAGFGFLLYLTLKNSSNITLKNYAFLFAIIIGTVYGASDELHQSFVPRRTASILDLLADCTGVALAQIIVFVGNRLSTPSTKKNNLDLKLAVILTILSIIFI
jgi:VanZ family protein